MGEWRQLYVGEALFDMREDTIYYIKTRTIGPPHIDDLQLFVMYQAGDEIQDDCSCDSICMRRIMTIVGEEIRNYFFGSGYSHKST